MSDPITEIDLLAYVDDQLDPARRIEVEDYLAGHPEAAMQVMIDLKHRDSLHPVGAAAPARMGGPARAARLLRKELPPSIAERIN